MSLDAVLDAVRRVSPASRVAALEAVAAMHDADQAARLPNPVLMLETENFAGSAPFGGFGRSESTFTLSQTVRLGGKRRLEHRAAEARAAVAAADHRVVLRASELEAARRFYEFGGAAAAAGSWAEILVLSNDFTTAVGRRVVAGKSAPTELARSRAATAIVRAAAAEASARAETARYALSALWGEHAPAFRSVRADFESRVAIPEGVEPCALVVRAMKWFAPRERPVIDLYDGVSGFSFPSGHTANVAITVIVLLWLTRSIPLACDRVRSATVRSLVVFVALVGLSRMYLLAHWPTDVVGGIMVAVCVASGSWPLFMSDPRPAAPRFLWVPVATWFVAGSAYCAMGFDGQLRLYSLDAPN